jgi:hypothetical protein
MCVLSRHVWYARKTGSNERVHHLDDCMILLWYECSVVVVVVVVYVDKKERVNSEERPTLLVHGIVLNV